MRGLGQPQDADADQHPEGEGEGLGHRVARSGGRDQAGVDIPQGGDALGHAAARLDDRQQHHHDGRGHDESLDGVGHDHGAESAHGRVEHHAEAEEGQPRGIGVARDGLEEPGSADELRQHGGHEEDDQRQGAEDDHGVAAVTGAQVVCDRHGPGFAATMANRFPRMPRVRKTVGTWIMASSTQLRPSR